MNNLKEEFNNLFVKKIGNKLTTAGKIALLAMAITVVVFPVASQSPESITVQAEDSVFVVPEIPKKMAIKGIQLLSVDTNMNLEVVPKKYGLVDYFDKELVDVRDYAYVIIEPSGCEEYHGNVKVRYDFFLTPDGYRYDDTYLYVVDWESEEAKAGYTGKVDEEGNPTNLVQYRKWEDRLPHIWQLNSFHSHFCYFAPDVTDEEIIKAGVYHLGNFYAAWCDDWADVAGGMRHGWDVETRIRLIRYDKDPVYLEYDTLQASCETRVDTIKILDISSASGTSELEGQTFPSTEIDVGAAAINRNSFYDCKINTAVAKANPANDTGSIDYVECYINSESGVQDVFFGTFSASGDTLTVNDSESVGNLSGTGLKTNSGLDIDVESGEYIGCNSKSGTYFRVETGAFGGSGLWYKFGEYIDPADSARYKFTSRGELSLYGTGETIVSCSEDISNTPSSENLGIVPTNSTIYAYGSAPSNPVVDGECTFTVTNNSGGAIDITIKATNFTGGNGWTLTSDPPDEDEVRLTAYYSGQNPVSGVVLTTSYQAFIDSLADSATKKWDFKMETGTFTDGVQKTSTITLSATCE